MFHCFNRLVVFTAEFLLNVTLLCTGNTVLADSYICYIYLYLSSYVSELNFKSIPVSHLVTE
jgi:hypothetical protein